MYAHAYICRAQGTLRAAFGLLPDPQQRTRHSGPHVEEEELANRAAGKRIGETDRGFLRRLRDREERAGRRARRICGGRVRQRGSGTRVARVDVLRVQEKIDELCVSDSGQSYPVVYHTRWHVEAERPEQEST